jgi:hypothetical protein
MNKGWRNQQINVPGSWQLRLRLPQNWTGKYGQEKFKKKYFLFFKISE